MRYLIFLTLFYGSSFSSLSQPRENTFKIKSKFVQNGQYNIQISLPPNYDSTRSYPLFYFLDLKLAIPLMKKISDSLLANNKVKEYIFVGIMCDDTARYCLQQRTRDFTISYMAEEDIYAGNNDSTKKISGGAQNFLKFLKLELLPTVESKYKSEQGQRTLFGISLSGLFAAYTLIEAPRLFKNYVIGAPAFWYNNFEIIEMLQKINLETLKGLGHVYMSIGSREDPEMLDGFEKFSTILKQKGVKVSKEIYEEKGHLDVWSILLEKGITAVFPKQK